MKTKLKTLTLLLTAFFYFSAEGQTLILSRYEIGGGPALFIYQGDLTPNRFGSFRTLRIGGQLFLHRILSNSSALRLNLAVGTLHGDDGKFPKPAWRQQRNFNFHSPTVELSLLGVRNITGGNYEIRKPVVYVLAGGGLTYLSVRRDWSRFNAEYFINETDLPARIAEDASHPTPRIIPVIPAGIGCRYSINERLSVYGEGIYRFTFTDYLDGFSKAVNDDKNDHYYTISAGVVYRFGRSKLDCPSFKN